MSSSAKCVAVLLCALAPSLWLAACDDHDALWAPTAARLSETAPDSFAVVVATSAGDVGITFVREWSPLAVDRAYYLMRHGFFDGARFYRVNDQYAQFGYSGQPALDSIWKPLTLPDEPVRASNVRGAVTFARQGPKSRSTVLFINLVDNPFLDSWDGDGVLGFPPIGHVTEGLDVLARLYAGYGEDPMFEEDSIAVGGNAFLDRRYPRLDSIAGTRVVRRW